MSDVIVKRTLKDSGVLLLLLYKGKYIKMAAALKKERHNEADELEASMLRRWRAKCQKKY